MDRVEVERVVQRLYRARIAGQREELCALFCADAALRIAGSGDGKAIIITASGQGEIRTWLSMLVKTFRLTDHEILSMLIDDASAAVHWRANIRSRITGAVVATEAVDLIQVRGGGIGSYTELFTPL